MNKKISLALIIAMLSMSFATYSTAVGVEILPDGGPGVVGTKDIESLAVIGAKEYNLEEKFTYVCENGCVVECPINIQTMQGVVTTKNHSVREGNIEDGTDTYLVFYFTGLKRTGTSIYIRAKSAEGVMVGLREVLVYNNVDYNPKTQKYKYKEETSFCSFKIPKSAAKVEVLGVLDSY